MSSLIEQFVEPEFFSRCKKIEMESIFVAHFIGYNHDIVWETNELYPSHYFYFYIRLPISRQVQEIVVRVYHIAEVVTIRIIDRIPSIKFRRMDKNQQVRIYSERHYWDLDHPFDKNKFSIGNSVYMFTEDNLLEGDSYVSIDRIHYGPKESKGELSGMVNITKEKVPGTVVFYNGTPNIKDVVFGLIKSEQVVTIKHQLY